MDDLSKAEESPELAQFWYMTLLHAFVQKTGFYLLCSELMTVRGGHQGVTCVPGQVLMGTCQSTAAGDDELLVP